MKINEEIPLVLFYKKVMPEDECKDAQAPMFDNAKVKEIAGIDIQESDVPSVNISIEAVTIHDTNTLKEAIEMILKVKLQNAQLMPMDTDLIDFDIGAQLVIYAGRVKAGRLLSHEGDFVDKLVKHFESLLPKHKESVVKFVIIKYDDTKLPKKPSKYIGDVLSGSFDAVVDVIEFPFDTKDISKVIAGLHDQFDEDTTKSEHKRMVKKIKQLEQLQEAMSVEDTPKKKPKVKPKKAEKGGYKKGDYKTGEKLRDRRTSE